MASNDVFSEAWDLWSSFKDEILYHNRYILNHPVLDYVKEFAERNATILEKGTILYRARQWAGDRTFLNHLDGEFMTEGLDKVRQLDVLYQKFAIKTKSETGFWGYDEKDSGAPIDNSLVKDGRTNPSYIAYLYTSENPYTALVEIRPYLDTEVSIAQIELVNDIKFADFSIDCYITNFYSLTDFEHALIHIIIHEFSEPCNSDPKGYIPTQYIAEYVKSLGFEAIRFNSSLHKSGKNVTIFNCENGKPISSNLYKVKDICFEASGLAPKDVNSLAHPRLQKKFPMLPLPTHGEN